MRWRWLLAAIPLLLGAAISVLLNATGRAPLLRIRIDLGTLLFFVGTLFSIFLGSALLCRARVEQARVQSAQLAAQDRRHFLRRLDHELKNPLTAILAGLANLSFAAGDGAEQPALESLNAQVQRLRRLVAELRKLSDLETRELEREAVDMTALLEEVFAVTEDHPGADERHLTLSIPRAPWPLPAVSGDRDLLFLAVYNPLDNALKFTAAADTIELRAAEDDGAVVIEIADTGPGIPPDEIPHVWEELYRGVGAQGIAGSGLGLPLVRAIVERHGGQVSLRSRPQQGTLVTLRLPVTGE